jgi:CRP/FNR family nitrogen fixation transcriptional regulator
LNYATLRSFNATLGWQERLVQIVTDAASRPNSLNALEMTSGSGPIVSLSELTYKRGDQIYGKDEPTKYVYQVKKGAVRRCRLLSDSRRQINSFHLSGDIFGLENGGVHRFTAEAVVETTVSLITRQSLEDVAEFDAVLSRNRSA